MRYSLSFFSANKEIPECAYGTNAGAFDIGILVILMLGAAVLSRLFIIWDGWYSLSAIPLNTAKIGLVDYLYLPVGLSHFLWFYYAALHDSKVYCKRDPGPFQRGLSIITLLTLPVCVLIGMFLPEFYIAAIGFWGV